MKHEDGQVDSEGKALVRLFPTEGIDRYGIAVRPRWPYTDVLLIEPALVALKKAQSAIVEQESRIRLAVIRGFETPKQTFGRNLLRRLGALLFFLAYPWRRAEIPGIFSANGHDRSGAHVDVRFSLAGRFVALLPLGPLTSLSSIRRTLLRYDRELKIVWRALETGGFRIHPNISEALQIHCDWIGEARAHER